MSIGTVGRRYGWVVAGAIACGGLVWSAAQWQAAVGRAASDQAKLHTGHLSCGPAALLVLVNAQDHAAAGRLQTILEREVLATRPVSSLYELAACAEQAGVHVAGLKIDSHNLARLPLPAIVHMRPGHFLALLAADGEHVTVAEPGPVTREIARREFDSQFTGYVLCARPTQVISRLHF